MLFMKVVSWYDDDSFQMLEVPTVGNSSIVMDFHFVANICRQHLSPTFVANTDEVMESLHAKDYR